MNSFVVAQGFAKKAMTSVVLGAVMNIVLDPILIFALNMGVQGAAIATVLSQIASCAYVLAFLFGPVSYTHLDVYKRQARMPTAIILSLRKKAF